MINRDYEGEIRAVKALGEDIGYGHLMALAAALWRENLKEAGLPDWGAPLPVLEGGIRDESLADYLAQKQIYDKLIKKHL